jgi:hypothetical protein
MDVRAPSKNKNVHNVPLRSMQNYCTMRTEAAMDSFFLLSDWRHGYL